MKLSVSRIALIGSLRSRIVVIISLLTISVQLAIYAIVDRTNKDFEQSHALSMSARIDDVASTVVNSEYQTLEYQLVKLTNQIPRNAAVSDVAALVDSANNDSTDSRYFVLRNSGSEVLNSEPRFSAENLPLVESAAATRSGFFEDGQAFLLATSSLANLDGYQLAVASGTDDHILPQIEKLTHIDAQTVRQSGEPAKARPGEATIAEFPEAGIVGVYQGSPALKGLIDQQQARLQILMASSLVIVLLLGMALARELTKPLKMLVDATRKIKNGDYSVKVEMLHQDEIGELAKTIDLMREHVGEREDEILKLAYADTLTELPNRALFDDRLNQTVMQGQRRQEAFAVVILDMDRFKYINDVLGHESGDFVLKEVASRLKLTLRKSDTVARLGGDEFALLLQDVTEQDILSAVDRIAGAFEHPVTLNNQPIDIGCSIGIAKYPEHGEDASTLLRRADMAMYSAKRSDTVFAFYDPNCDEHREEHLSLLSEIKRAIEKDELQLFFQPKVTFDDSSILSVETLLRWQHPKRGLIPPDEFIPFAEQTGAIRLITRWLIAKATVQAKSWADQGLMVKMSLNISARDLLDSDFSSYIKKRLDENEVDPAMICMEITESALMEDPIKARRTVEELHQLGLSISIDDYGTGYSSLAYVKNLPVNELKIDREFIKNMLENKEDVAIVRSTIELGHNLGLKVVAEGIEREEEMQMLKDFGCDQAQGYLISKALTASDMEAWIAKNLPGDDRDEPPLLKSVG